MTMPTPSDASKGENSYPIDPENVVEMARLLNQDKLTTQAMGGVLSEQPDTIGFRTVLDLACGPGGWVLDVARQLPDAQVTGVDVSKLMVDYGRATAKAWGLHNAHFTVMNIVEPLNFPDNSFDLINERDLVAVLTPETWPALLDETFRICRHGGIMRLTEGEMPVTSSPAFERITHMALKAFRMTRRNFGPDDRHFGITPRMASMLRKAGYQNVREKAYAINFSAGTEVHEAFYQDFMAVFHLGRPFFVKLGLTSEEEYEELYQQMLREMMADNFCAIHYKLTVWGEKP